MFPQYLVSEYQYFTRQFLPSLLSEKKCGLGNLTSTSAELESDWSEFPVERLWVPSF